MSDTDREAAKVRTTFDARRRVVTSVRSIAKLAVLIISPTIRRAATSQRASMFEPCRDVREIQSTHDRCGRVRIRGGTNTPASGIDNPTF
jgi:hypothetical protein